MSCLKLLTEDIRSIEVNAGGEALGVADATVVEAHFLRACIGRGGEGCEKESKNLISCDERSRAGGQLNMKG